MKTFNHLLLCAGLSLFSQSAFSQAAPKTSQKESNENTVKKNIVKINLTSLAFKNFSLQYEHVVAKKMSVALGVSIMPKSDLPFAGSIKEQYGDDPQAQRALESTKLGNFSITPEFRFYLSKRAPKGFYIAPFMRYNNLSLDQLYEFTANNNKVYKPLIKGNVDNIGGGILFGAQFMLGKNLSLDWWIAGPIYGKSKGHFVGTEDLSTMSAADKKDLENDIEDLNIPLTDIDATVTNTQVDVKLSGPYAGLRAFGFCLGFRF